MIVTFCFTSAKETIELENIRVENTCLNLLQLKKSIHYTMVPDEHKINAYKLVHCLRCSKTSNKPTFL